MTQGTIDPHSAERLILIGCHDAASRPHAMRLALHPEQREAWMGEAIRWLSDTVKYATTTCTIMVQPEYQDWPEVQAIVELTHNHYKQAQINQNTVEAIGETQGRNFVMNLRRIVETEGVMQDARLRLPNMHGQTVVICGAGPSLDTDAHWAALHRGPVIAVNTSAGACAQHGIRPIAVVCTETKPVREGIRRIPDGSALAMDLIGHPSNWVIGNEGRAAEGTKLCFIGTEPNLAAYAKTLDMLPLAYGSSCTTAAVSLALACGAARVALIGQDCAFKSYAQTVANAAYHPSAESQSAWPASTTEGDDCIAARMYASGTPYESTAVIINATKRRAAIRKPTVGIFETDVLMVPGIDDEQLWTTHSMLSFAHWFRDQPQDVRARVVNCTSHGVYIDGIEHAAIKGVIERSGKTYGSMHGSMQLRSVPAEDPYAWRAAQVLKHLSNVARHGAKIRHDVSILEWARGHGILGMWTGPARLRMRRSDDMSSAERGHYMAAVIRRACDEITQCAHGEWKG